MVGSLSFPLLGPCRVMKHDSRERNRERSKSKLPFGPRKKEGNRRGGDREKRTRGGGGKRKIVHSCSSPRATAGRQRRDVKNKFGSSSKGKTGKRGKSQTPQQRTKSDVKTEKSRGQ